MIANSSLNGSKTRYLTTLSLNVVASISLILCLAYAQLRTMPGYYAKAHSSEALTFASTIRQDITAFYYETGRWPKPSIYSEYQNEIIKQTRFDGNGGLHFIFNEKDKLLAGHTLSLIATVNPEVSPVNMIWLCGHSSLPEGYQRTTNNLTDLPRELLVAACRDLRLKT